jgi:hypothetical protein
MPHVQAYLDTAVFKEVKKDAIDKNLQIGDYVKEAVVKKLEDSKKEVVEEAEKSEPNNLTITDNKIQGE